MRCGSVADVVFGSVAEDYERCRRGYPDELVETVLGYVGGRSAPLSKSARAPARPPDASPREACTSRQCTLCQSATDRSRQPPTGKIDVGTARH
jgi:hypothetical protein